MIILAAPSLASKSQNRAIVSRYGFLGCVGGCCGCDFAGGCCAGPCCGVGCLVAGAFDWGALGVPEGGAPAGGVLDCGVLDCGAGVWGFAGVAGAGFGAGLETFSNTEPLPSTALSVRRTRDRKSTRLNSSHLVISYAVFCLKKKKNVSRQSSH